ncbi:MAG TPA: DUF2516 family protein [Marmoricola sp.]|nr:DUF2516 family protein [Marmoricola sp.]
MVFAFESQVIFVISLAMLALELWALVDAVVRPSQAYVATDKLTKPAWLVILGLALACSLVLPFFLLRIAAVVAACVYLVDVRPALSSVTRRR